MKRHILAIAACAALLGACAGGSEAPPDEGAGGTGGTGSGGAGGHAGEAVRVPASTREVRFASHAPDRFEHVGVLQIPAHVEGAALPAVVFAQGSGPSDRDHAMDRQLAMTFGKKIAAFVEIGDALQEAGFAVLRFDKRSCGPFNGCADNDYVETPDLTIDTLVQDVEGGLAFLEEQPEIDPDRLFFLGHSLGATYAPRLLTDHENVRAGVMLAGPFRPIDAILEAQAEKIEEAMLALGRPQAEIDATVAPIYEQVEDLRALRAGNFEGETIDDVALAFWESWLRLGDEAPGLAAALDRPLLVVSGDYDWNVPPAETEAWREHLGADSIHQVEILPCVTHALNCITQPDWLRVRSSDIGGHVDEQVIDAVVDFLSAQR